MGDLSLKEQFAKAIPGDLGIIGDPIEHSLSPVMQNAALRTWAGAFRDREKPSPTYHRFLVKPDQLKEALQLAKDRQMRGVNVTIPHKTTVCEYVTALDTGAQAVKAVNTILFQGNELKGFNTDAHGFRRSLSHDLEVDVNGQIVFVIGAGGTARIIVSVLTELGASRIYIWNRSEPHLRELVESMKNTAMQSVKTADVARASRESMLLVNASAVGLKSGDGLPVEGLSFSARQKVFDVIYHRETEFLEQARRAGAQTSNGLNMLLYQGAKAFEIWTNTPAPVDVMRAALLNSLKG